MLLKSSHVRKLELLIGVDPIVASDSIVTARCGTCLSLIDATFIYGAVFKSSAAPVILCHSETRN